MNGGNTLIQQKFCTCDFPYVCRFIGLVYHVWPSSQGRGHMVRILRDAQKIGLGRLFVRYGVCASMVSTCTLSSMEHWFFSTVAKGPYTYFVCSTVSVLSACLALACTHHAPVIVSVAHMLSLHYGAFASSLTIFFPRNLSKFNIYL
jgi:hypothetical protein